MSMLSKVYNYIGPRGLKRLESCSYYSTTSCHIRCLPDYNCVAGLRCKESTSYYWL